MYEVKDFYRELLQKDKEVKERMKEIDQELSALPDVKKSIVIKQIQGKLYYYAQWRENGKLCTKYLCPVGSGTIADQELKILGRQDLLREKKEQLQLQKHIEQMLRKIEGKNKKQKIIEDYSFEVYWKDEITARVSVQGKKVKVSRYTEHPLKQLFAEALMTRHQLNRILELRCWERDRADIREILSRLGLKEYNPYEIVKRTHGVSYNDYIWFRFPGEKLTSNDVLVR